MNGTGFLLIGAAASLAVGARWLILMRRVRIPADVRPYLAASAVVALCGIGAFVLGVGPVGGIAAALLIVGGAALPALYAASGQARVAPAVTVGGPVLDFVAQDERGEPFDLTRLRGAPVLIKFFRGHWCPYCVAELRRWEEMRPLLDAHGIVIVTICADTADQIRRGRGKHGLRAVMLPDPDLVITDRYRLRNPRNFALKSGVIVPLPIPTTILVDAAGTVGWIDQSADYMHRSEPERVMTAIRAALEPQPAERAAAVA